MKHPQGRAARRHVRETYILYRNRIIKRLWTRPGEDPADNLAWGCCAKRNFAHGCRMCKYEKYDLKSVRKRRRGLDQEIVLNQRSWKEDTNDTLEDRR